MSAILVFSLRLLLVLLSYTFLGWMIYTIFTDLKMDSSQKTKQAIPPIILEAQIEEEKSKRRFRQKEIFLGRDPSVDFPLNNETISLRHCKISHNNKQWWVKDLESTNGTYLNNEPVKTETIITNGDQLRLGKVEILITINQNTELE
jgi:pSer/pThr/pTyr-binding forkhead associated (FHA) protein